MKLPYFLYPVLTSLALSSASADEKNSGNAEHIVHSTFKLFNSGSTATCFLVHREDSPDNPVIISAAHVFEKMKGDTAIIVLRNKDDSGKYQRHDHEIQVRDKKKSLWTRHPKHDIAVLPLAKKPDGIPCPSLAATLLASTGKLKESGITICKSVFVLGYPERTEANSGGFPVARHATVASFPLTPVKHYPSFMIDFNTFGGDSGAPVFAEGSSGTLPLIIGIVAAQYRYDEKLKMLNEERSVHHPLGLSKVLHSQFIIETLAMLADKDK
ncbi:MAG: serine protease, partial [Verrucomicrobiales bacterium]